MSTEQPYPLDAADFSREATYEIARAFLTHMIDENQLDSRQKQDALDMIRARVNPLIGALDKEANTTGLIVCQE